MAAQFPTNIQIVGSGRLGSALETALRATGVQPLPTAGRGASCAAADLVLLAVPDAQLAAAAMCIAPGRLVCHFSGMTTLAALHPRVTLSVHPLLTVTPQTDSFAGAYAAIDGVGGDALGVAQGLAELLGMVPLRVADADRAAYHAAASIASNFQVTLADFAERLAASAGVPRAALVPLMAASLRHWAASGASALTGPITRGDEQTVALQRAAVVERLPARVALFDELAAATRELAAETGVGAGAGAGAGVSAGADVSAGAAPTGSQPVRFGGAD